MKKILMLIMASGNRAFHSSNRLPLGNQAHAGIQLQSPEHRKGSFEMVSRITPIKSLFLAGILMCFSMALQPANAISSPTLTIGGPDGTLFPGEPETFGCNSGTGTLAKGTVYFYVIGAGSETGEVDNSNGSSSIRYTFPSLVAGTYEAYCQDGSSYSNTIHFTIEELLILMSSESLALCTKPFTTRPTCG
jgi:hypothetical protein